MELPRLVSTRKTGHEHFQLGSNSLDVTVLDFWQWIASDLVGNSMRGLLAEFIVASALGLASDIREEWRPFDLLTLSGKKIEVKSAAYLQSWNQSRFSKIIFNIRRTRAWDSETNIYSAELKRQAHIYVFALLIHQDKNTVNPLNLDQWRFYVVPSELLNARAGNSITLQTLEKICPLPIAFSDLRSAIEGRAVSV